MPTTVKISEDLRKIIENVQKEQKKEYFKEAHELLIRLGLEAYQKGNTTIQEIEIREPIEDSENQIQCPYGSLIENGLVYCDNPKKKNLPKNHLIPIEACQKCWKREQDKKTQINAIMKKLHEHWELFHCFGYDFPKFNGGEVHKPEDFLKLACFQDFNFDEPEKCGDYAECPLHFHKEWRKLIAENLDKIF